MGRNAGSQVFWTHVFGGTDHIITHVCQQHGEWDQLTNVAYTTATNVLMAQHIGTDHGCVQQ